MFAPQKHTPEEQLNFSHAEKMESAIVGVSDER